MLTFIILAHVGTQKQHAIKSVKLNPYTGAGVDFKCVPKSMALFNIGVVNIKKIVTCTIK